jgi:hypothetical protein
MSIVCFMGVIGSGKDYRAAQAMAGPGKPVRVDFKDGLLDMVRDLVGYDPREDYEWFKQSVVGVRREPNRFMQSYQSTDQRALAARHPELMTGRRLLQRLGTDVMRKRDPDHWARVWAVSAHRALDERWTVVNADCRFINEVSMVLKVAEEARVPARFVFCDYRSPRYDPAAEHESEKLAQALLKLGLRDGDDIRPIHFLQAESLLQ